MIFKTEAVVLKKDKISEADVILTLFTRKYGKIRAVAKSARKPKTRLSAASHLFVYGEFIINKGRNLDTISSVDIIESFYKIREDLLKLSYASYFTELCNSVIVEGVTNNRLFHMLLNALNIITHGKEINYDFIKVVYEIKLLDYSGLRPELERCVSCGTQNFSRFAFSPELGGLICDNCNIKQKYFRINETTVKLIEYILTKDIQILSKIKINPPLINMLNNIFERYISFHLEIKYFKSLNFLNEIRKI